MSVKQKVFFALSVVAFHWFATFSAPRPLPSAVPHPPKFPVSLHLEEL